MSAQAQPQNSARASWLKPSSAVAVVLGVLAALVLGMLLSRLVFQGRSLSFDAIIYSQSLWGIGHGHWYNTVVESPHLGIHLNIILLALAPLTWFMPAAQALLTAQSVAFGATVTLTAAAFARMHQKHAPDTTPTRQMLAALFGGALVSLGSPIVLNPFLFDIRPGILAVPFVVAGLLRALDRGGVDKWAIVWMLPAALAREEYTLLIAAGLALRPPEPNAEISPKTRWTVAFIIGAWFPLVWFVINPWMRGRGEAVLKGHITGVEWNIADWLTYKGLFFTVAAASLGGWMVWRGWRYLGAALPGAGIILINLSLLDQQINFHYSSLIAPGIIVAAVAGYRAWLIEGQPQRSLRYGFAILVAALSFGFASSAPGGARFASWHFDMQDKEGALRLDPRQHNPDLLAIHAMLDGVDPNIGLAVPYFYGAAVAGRPVVRLDIDVKKHLIEHNTPPKDIATVALRRKHWPSVGRFLVGVHGFRLAERKGDVALLTRENPPPIPFKEIVLSANPTPCDKPLASWPQAGLTLCGVALATKGRLAATVMRHGPPAQGFEDTPVSLQVLTGSPESPTSHELWLMDGLVPLHMMRPRMLITTITDKPVPAPEGAVILLPPGGKNPLMPKDAQSPAVPVRWSTP